MINTYIIDCMDYGEWKTGVRVEGMIASIVNFSNKVGGAIASGVVGLVMGLAGYDGLLPPYTREAPTFFERNGKKYLFTSGTSGYFPKKSDVCVFDDYHGEYKSLGNPHVGDRSETSFSSQITSVIRLPGSDSYIACADRWMPQWYIKPLARTIVSGMERHFKDYVPDTGPREITSVPGQLLKHGENTCLSRYVWLPIEWEGDKPVICWRKEWRPKPQPVFL